MRLFKHQNPEYKTKILDYTYTSEPSINSALPLRTTTAKLVFFIFGCLVSFGFLWLIARWSSKKKAIFLYNVCDVGQATHFLIQEEGVIGGSTIVKRFDKFDVRRKERSEGFCYHQRTYLFHPEKDVFLPIRYEDLGIQLDRLKKGRYEPYRAKSRRRLLDYYGPNQINMHVPTILQVFIEEMLTPWEVFQMYAILLWIYEDYYLFSFILLGYSLYTYWVSSSEVAKNQQKLSQQSYFEFKCKIITKDSQGFMAMSREDSQELTIVEQLKTDRDDDFHDEKFMKFQEEMEPKGRSILGNSEVETNKNTSGYQGSHTSRSNASREGFDVVEIDSRDLLPGDILILSEGDVVPCDCLILSGEALVDEQFITGESFLMRKIELQNYSKQKQKNFLLYLGTKIVKVKSNHFFKFDDSHLERAFEQTQTFYSNLLGPKEIACIVSQTNYNTQRGKYLRAVRYQKKPTQNFTRESIYFIYIILGITTLVFLILLPVISENHSTATLFLLYIDLIAVSIPMTLPTALSVGISFAQHRLENQGIHSVLPSNILAGGRSTTIVLDTNKIFGKKYEMESMMVGVKPNRGMGTTYSSLNQFLDINHEELASQSFRQDPQKKKQQILRLHRTGKMLIRAFASCHTLEYYNNSLSGTVEDKHIYSFADAKYIDEDKHSCLNDTISIRQRIFFREKDRKLAVFCSIKEENPASKHSIVLESKEIAFLESDDNKMEEEERQPVEEEFPLEANAEMEERLHHVLFIKGPAEKILPICRSESYPMSAHEYVLDMAQKGFKLICYAFKSIHEEFDSEKDIKELREDFVFCGFAILQTERNEENQGAIQHLKRSKIQMILMSEDRELDASSMAIHNNICNKNELLLCSYRKKRVICRGHTEWQSTEGSDEVAEFITEADEFVKRSHISLTSKLYQELFMKRDEAALDRILNNTLIFNEMENRHARNLYFQLEKRNLVSFAVGSGGSVSECAHLSLELERGQCSLLSSFHTESKSLSSIPQCLIICRAALATNFHCFSMMILFSLVQFTTVCLLYNNYQIINDDQMLYEDLFVTFPIFITINLTKPVDKLSKELPPSSFFSRRALSSMIGQLLIQFAAQFGFIFYLFSMKNFIRERDEAHLHYVRTGQFAQSGVTLAMFILTNYLYLGIVLSTSVSKPFRKPFYTNPYYTLTLLVLWLYNTGIVLIPQIAPGSVRKKDLDKEVQYVLVIAMLLGNLVMVLMYLYENLLVWVWDLSKKLTQIDPTHVSTEAREMM